MTRTAVKPKGRAAVRQAGLFKDPSTMTDAELAAELEAVILHDDEYARRWMCDRPDCDGDPHDGWLHRHARASQRIPDWWWTEWLILAGRGWGKTKTAAETVREWAKEPGLSIAVVAKNDTLVREICFESPKSGLLAVIPPEDIASYTSSRGAVTLTLKNGTVIRGFGAEVPDNLRGWAFDKAWMDEYAAWTRKTAQATYDMLWFCLREAEVPQVIISTTPKPLPHVRAILRQHEAETARAVAEHAERGEDVPLRLRTETVVTRGHTDENRANLSDRALAKIENRYAGTRLGAQELAGEVLEDIEGALWQGWMFEVDEFRLDPDSPRLPTYDRKVVSVDPATTHGDNADNTGIVVAGRTYSYDWTYKDQQPHGFVLHAEEVNTTPRRAMERAIALYHLHGCDAIVVEANNGGEYLSTVIQMLDPTVPVKVVHATRDKRTRATPVATLYEQERIHHVGVPAMFDTLETQQTTYVGLGSNAVEESPDLLDALVWALTDLLLDPSTPRGDEGTGTVRDSRLRRR